MCVPNQIGIGGCTCVSRHPFSQIYNVHGHPSIFRHVYFGAAPRRACGSALAAGARGCARVGLTSASGCSRRSERTGVPITRMRVCACNAWRLLWLRPVRPHVRPSSRGGCGPHARAVRGRYIYSTKVRALPEWLGRCKLLEGLCVPRPPPPPCAFAAVPALRCCAWRCRAGALVPAPRGVGCGGGGVAGRRPRPSPARAWLARAGAQGGVQHRARGAAGGGRLAEPQETVSAPPPPRQLGRADAPTRGRAGRERARTRRA